MNMVRLEVDFALLLRWAHAVRVPSEDTGYLIHAALRTAFGELAPQPFVCLQGNGASLEILGYGEAPAEILETQLTEINPSATPAPSDLLRRALSSLDTKKFPDHWQMGTVLRFQVLGCPLRRFRSDNAARSVREKDVYLLDIECARKEDKPAPDRATSYLCWLEGQLNRDNAAALLEARLVGHRLVQPVRRGKEKHEGAASRIGTRPEAQFEGLLRVNAPEAFINLLQRGVGRHRAFGYGMLLVRAG